MPKKFFVKGKDIITDADAPVVSNEFVDKREDGEYRGQTIEVQSETKLEQDTGTGSELILRTYEFKVHPDYLRPGVELPTAQDIFQSHMRGIAGMLWGDGLSPETGIEPRLIFTKDRTKYLIMVWARPSLGRVLTDKPKTLSEIINGQNDPRQNRDAVQRSVSVSPTSKKKTGRAAKASQ